nr:GFA family protein [Agrobacterium pusense]
MSTADTNGEWQTGEGINLPLPGMPAPYRLRVRRCGVFEAVQVTAAGNHNAFLRRGESGKKLEFRFCPCCGSTVYWLPEFRPNLVAIALGCFEDSSGIEPTQSVYEAMQFPWVSLCL